MPHEVYRNQTIIMHVPNPPGDFMKKTPATEVNIDARVEWKRKLVKNAEGEEVISNVNIMIDFNSSIYYDHKFEIDSVVFSVISIDRVQDFSPQYLIVYLS